MIVIVDLPIRAQLNRKYFLTGFDPQFNCTLRLALDFVPYGLSKYHHMLTVEHIAVTVGKRKLRA